MYHPLLEDVQKIKDNDLENKIFDLTRKYHIAARSGSGELCSQILTILDSLREEQRVRHQKTLSNLNNKNNNLDELINVD